MAQQVGAIVYPTGVKDLPEDISTDDLVRRLRVCAHVFSNMPQDEDNARIYKPLAHLLLTERFIEHRSTDVRVLVACCLADICRVSCPDPPFVDPEQLKMMLNFFVDNLKGLDDPHNPSFKQRFYLIENLSQVKTFNTCTELPECQPILCRLFSCVFEVISDHQFIRITRIIVDMLTPLITELDLVSPELLDIILTYIIEPAKTEKKHAYMLARELLEKTASTLEPYIQAFFNNALLLGAPVQSVLTEHLFELIYELNNISPSMMAVVVPQLEEKLKSGDEEERMAVTKLVARMFSDKDSKMIEQNSHLWSCFLARFNDISIQIREVCVSHARNFLLYHPEAKKDIIDLLKFRRLDLEGVIRGAVVTVIINTAKEDISCVNADLLELVKDRVLDKKVEVRKEAVNGLARLYKQYMISTKPVDPKIEKMLSFIKNKLLHFYYQNNAADRLLCERVLHTCLIPYQAPNEDRIKIMYQLYCTIDDHAVRAFKEILKCQKNLRDNVMNVLEVIQQTKSDGRQRLIEQKVHKIAQCLVNPVEATPHLLKFCAELEVNIKLRSCLSFILNGTIESREKVESNVREIMRSLGNAVQGNNYYLTIRQLLQRIIPVMLDKDGIKYLVTVVQNAVVEDGKMEAELGLKDSVRRGIELLLTLSFTHPSFFCDEDIYVKLSQILQADDEFAAMTTLQLLKDCTDDLECRFPHIYRNLLPILENFLLHGTPKQAKYAVHCIYNIVSDKRGVFGQILEDLKKHLTLESQHFRTALVSIGHIAFLCHNLFADDFKTIVSKLIVKEVLMLDKDLPRGGDKSWDTFDSLPDETKVKIEGMKVMVRWLRGLRDRVQPTISSFRLFLSVIKNKGDLMERGHMAPMENAWMRLSAACCILKLCREPRYCAAVTIDQYEAVAYIMHDDCKDVREIFAQKLNKGLSHMKLPLEYLAVFALVGLLSEKDDEEFRKEVASYLKTNILKRRKFIAETTFPRGQMALYLPDYSIQYAVYLLAHAPFFKEYNDVPSLLKIKECLNFFMDALILKNDDYNFAFFKRLLENIKQTKDVQMPNNNDANLKIYAVCDLALNKIMSGHKFILKDFPAKPLLNKRFFTDADKNFSNMKTYLPPELLTSDIAKAGFEVVPFDPAKPSTSHDTPMNSASHGEPLPSTSHGEPVPSTSQEMHTSTVKKGALTLRSNGESVPSTSRGKGRPNTKNLKTSYVPSQKSSEPCEHNQPVTPSEYCPVSYISEHSDLSSDGRETWKTNKAPISEIQLNGDISNAENNSDCSDEDSGLDDSVTNHKIPLKSRNHTVLRNKLSKKFETKARSTRSVSRSVPDSESEICSGLLPEPPPQQLSSSPSITSVDSSCPSSFQHLIKACNVYLNRQEVENYTSKFFNGTSLKRKPNDMEFGDQNSSSSSQFCEFSTRKRGRPAKQVGKQQLSLGKRNNEVNGVRKTGRTSARQNKKVEIKPTAKRR